MRKLRYWGGWVLCRALCPVLPFISQGAPSVVTATPFWSLTVFASQPGPRMYRSARRSLSWVTEAKGHPRNQAFCTKPSCPPLADRWASAQRADSGQNSCGWLPAARLSGPRLSRVILWFPRAPPAPKPGFPGGGGQRQDANLLILPGPQLGHPRLSPQLRRA